MLGVEETCVLSERGRKMAEEDRAVEVTREAMGEERVLGFLEIRVPVINQAQFDLLYGRTPPHAIRTRPGRGGRTFRYVPHGYVTDKLNKAFGFDWDFRLLPVFGGDVYVLKEFEERGKKQRHVAVYGELTVRIRDREMRVVAEITKPGPGSQVWDETVEFGDALKGAAHDGLKVAATALGIALDLYYDDEAELAKWEEAQLLSRGNGSGTEPTSLVELIARAQRELGLDAVGLCERLGVRSVAEIGDVEEAWRVVGSRQ